MQSFFRRWVAVSLLATLGACASGGSVGPGYYRVERGDTLGALARRHGQSVANLVRWNNLSNPNVIAVGQVLRIAPPDGSRAGATAGVVRTGPASSTSSSASAAASSSPTTAAPVAPSLAPATSIALLWPASGPVLRGFDGVRSKGIDIGGQAGSTVSAAAAGVVVYAGNGLRGYGNLLIIKHNADFLTAYAHNRALLVKEGQSVKQGQAIAEMGDSDNDRVMLHFELRYQGRSIDPSRYLPAR